MLYFHKFFVLTLFIVGSFLMLPLSVQAADGDEAERAISNTVLPFFKALTSGDVRAIESHIEGKLALNMKTLLRENQEYPEILRRHYKDAIVRVSDTFEEAGCIFVQVEIDFPESKRRFFELLLKDKDGTWKIFRQTEHK